MTTKNVNAYLILCFISFFSPPLTVHSSPHYPYYVNEVMSSCALEIEKEFKVIYTGNSSIMPYDIEQLGFNFTAYRKGSIEEARELSIKIAHKLVKAVNADEKIRPYLREFPFTETRVNITVSFSKKNNLPYTDGSVCYAFFIRDKLVFYRVRDPSSFETIKIFEEPYDDAIKILRNTLRLSSEEIH